MRTSLTYLALFVLTLVLVFIYTILTFIGNVTAEKEANFKAIVTHKTVIPSQMPPGYYDQFKRLVLEELPPDMRAWAPGLAASPALPPDWPVFSPSAVPTRSSPKAPMSR